jgi:hypothetical protein
MEPLEDAIVAPPEHITACLSGSDVPQNNGGLYQSAYIGCLWADAESQGTVYVNQYIEAGCAGTPNVLSLGYRDMCHTNNGQEMMLQCINSCGGGGGGPRDEP